MGKVLWSQALQRSWWQGQLCGVYRGCSLLLWRGTWHSLTASLTGDTGREAGWHAWSTAISSAGGPQVPGLLPALEWVLVVRLQLGCFMLQVELLGGLLWGVLLLLLLMELLLLEFLQQVTWALQQLQEFLRQLVGALQHLMGLLCALAGNHGG